MRSIWIGTAATVLVALAALGVGYAAGTSAAPTQATAAAPDKAGVEAIVRDYLLANPEIMLEVQTALQAKQEAAQKAVAQASIGQNRELIFNAAYDGIVGNPQGTQTIVEFFDYNCGYCKRALPDMDKLVQDNPNLRFVLKELPILGPDSHAASVVSMAFHRLAPAQYGDFHRALLGAGGRASEEKAVEVAASLGVDEAALRAEMKNPEIEKAFAETYELANGLSITGTPSYVIGNEVVFGAMGAEVLAEKVQNLSN